MTSHQEEIIYLYFNEELRPVDIANKLKISKSAVTQVLKKDERYIEEKELRKQANRIKHNEETKDYMENKREINSFRQCCR